MTIKDAEQLARELLAKHLGTVCCHPLYEEFEKAVGENAEVIIRNEIRRLAAKLKIAPETIFFGYTNSTHRFEIVKKIPRGFFVWNIGECMETDCLIPLCELKDGGGNYDIEPTTLKAIKLPRSEVEFIRNAAGWGITSLTAARRYIEPNANPYMKELAEKVLPIYERISED